MQEALPQRNRPRGLRHAARPRLPLTAAKFNGLYVRPNLQNDGTVPADGQLCDSPDIWISGTQPLDPDQLKKQSSYQASSSNNITLRETNYIYVRARNGTTSPLSRTVQLYFAPSAVIQWPGDWQYNRIPTDQGPDSFQTNINNLPPDAIGVADDVFQWAKVPPPPGDSHYCLFAQLNDEQDSNPFPEVGTQLDMSALVKKNLGWGWRNTAAVAGTVATWQYQLNLNVPENQQPATYCVYVHNKNFLGWLVQFQCSRLDANNKQIMIPQTKIIQDGQMSGVTCYLNPGFNSSITVSAYRNGAANPPEGSSISLECTYQASGTAEAMRAITEGLVDLALQTRLRRMLGPNIRPQPWVSLGAQHYVVRQSAASRRS